jgi:hypothetical protein
VAIPSHGSAIVSARPSLSLPLERSVAFRRRLVLAVDSDSLFLACCSAVYTSEAERMALAFAARRGRTMTRKLTPTQKAVAIRNTMLV